MRNNNINIVFGKNFSAIFRGGLEISRSYSGEYIHIQSGENILTLDPQPLTVTASLPPVGGGR